jgi:hypothetical protein
MLDTGFRSSCAARAMNSLFQNVELLRLLSGERVFEQVRGDDADGRELVRFVLRRGGNAPLLSGEKGVAATVADQREEEDRDHIPELAVRCPDEAPGLARSNQSLLGDSQMVLLLSRYAAVGGDLRHAPRSNRSARSRSRTRVLSRRRRTLAPGRSAD